MDIFNIEAFIALGKKLTPDQIDLNDAYIQIGLYTPPNRRLGGDGTAYPTYVMKLSDLVAPPTGPKVFRALINNGPDPISEPITMTVLEDTLSEGAGYTLGFSGPGQYTLAFTNPVLTAGKTATPSSGTLAGLLSADITGTVLEAPEVHYTTFGQIVYFQAFNIGSQPNDGYFSNHYLEILVFP